MFDRDPTLQLGEASRNLPQLATDERLYALQLVRDFLLYLSNLLGDEALSGGSDQHREDPDPDDHHYDGDQATRLRDRPDVAVPDRRHRADGPPDAIPRVIDVVVRPLLDSREPSTAEEDRQQPKQRGPLKTLRGEQPPRGLDDSEQPEQPEQPEYAKRLQAGRKERRRQDDNGYVERIVEQPAPPVRDDGKHEDDFGKEDEPDRPVRDSGNRYQRVVRVG